MIPTTDTSRKLTGSLGGERHQMSIHAHNIPHLMGILTDLYSDPEMAVIREYSTNALDSHIMAKVDKPIQISLPTPLRQTFEVRDFGLGLSVDEIVEVYGSYGASTKRDTNDAQGCLGLGSKSALTYTNMFTVRAIKNGVQAEVAFFRNEDGSGAIEVVDTKSTTEHNGVTIIVPTKANSSFKEKALKLYQVWKPGTVEVIGETIDFIAEREGVVELSHGYAVPRKTENGAKTFIVMGNVPYPLNSQGTYYDKFDFYHFADMGAVEFVPSREALNFTPSTRRYADRVLLNLNDQALKKYIKGEIEKAKTLAEAYEAQNMFAERFGRALGTFHWNGTYLSNSANTGKVRIWEVDENIEQRYAWSTTYSIYYAHAHKYAFVKKPERFTHKNKVQLRQLLAKKYPDVEYIVLADRPTDNFLQFTCKQIPWSKIEKEIVPKAVRQKGAPKPKPEYHFYHGERGYLSHDHAVLPDDKKMIWSLRGPFHNQAEWLKENKDYIFVHLAPNRVDKFVRENPKAVQWSEIQAELEKALPQFTDAEKAYMSLHWMRAESVLPWLVKNGYATDFEKEIASIDKRALAKKQQAWDNVGKDYDKADHCVISRKYPLLDYNTISSHPKHTRLYVEAVRNSE